MSGLDGIRAVAIVLVIGNHLAQRKSHPLLRALFNHQDGVGLFFTLSGFLVTSLLLQEKLGKGRISIRHFYFRRAMRILPPLITYIAAVSIGALLVRAPLTRLSVFSALFFFFNILRTGDWQLQHTWSLSVEEQFYVLWPLILVVAVRFGRKALAAACLTLILAAPLLRILGTVHAWPWMLHKQSYLLPTRMDALLAGCLAATLIGSVRFEVLYRQVEKFWWIAPVFLFLVSPGLGRSFSSYYDFSLGFTLNALAAASLILWLSRNKEGLVCRIADWGPIAKLGMASYSIYLWQMLATHYAVGLFPSILALILLAVVSSLSFIFVEGWSTKARKRMERLVLERQSHDFASESTR